MDKNLFVITVCNGGGKTKASFTILPENNKLVNKFMEKGYAVSKIEKMSNLFYIRKTLI